MSTTEIAKVDTTWHLDRKVPISIIIVIILQCVAGLWAIADIKKDVELLKDARVEQRERDMRQDKLGSDALDLVRKTSAESIELVRNDIKEVSRKLDRLFERNSAGTYKP